MKQISHKGDKKYNNEDYVLSAFFFNVIPVTVRTEVNHVIVGPNIPAPTRTSVYTTPTDVLTVKLAAAVPADKGTLQLRGHICLP